MTEGRKEEVRCTCMLFNAGTLLQDMSTAEATGWSLGAFIKAELQTREHLNFKLTNDRTAAIMFSQTILCFMDTISDTTTFIVS